MVILGVGKNMVRSIHHWCEALGLIESYRRGQYRQTELGTALFSLDGWDPYMENIGTLWLLHWQLVNHWDTASTWYLAFTKWNVQHFTRDDLINWLQKVLLESPSTRVALSTLRRDVDVFIRTYVPSRVTRNIPPEDTFDCPLVELGLIEEVEHGLYQFVRGPKPSLPEEIFLYALVDFWERIRPNQHSLSFDTVLHGLGSPGGAFKLSENALINRLERLTLQRQLTYDDTAGMRTILCAKKERISPIEILRSYYGKMAVRRI